MKLRKHKLLTFLVYAVVSNLGYAAYPDAIRCPDAAIVRQSNINESNMVEKSPGRETCCDANGFPYHERGEWDVGMREDYGTAYQWSMSTNALYADTAHEAFSEIKQRLVGLILSRGPYREWGVVYCEYKSAKGDVNLSHHVY